jgi:hypothetical protein
MPRRRSDACSSSTSQPQLSNFAHLRHLQAVLDGIRAAELSAEEDQALERIFGGVKTIFSDLDGRSVSRVPPLLYIAQSLMAWAISTPSSLLAAHDRHEPSNYTPFSSPTSEIARVLRFGQHHPRKQVYHPKAKGSTTKPSALPRAHVLTRPPIMFLGHPSALLASSMAQCRTHPYFYPALQSPSYPALSVAHSRTYPHQPNHISLPSLLARQAAGLPVRPTVLHSRSARAISRRLRNPRLVWSSRPTHWVTLTWTPFAYSASWLFCMDSTRIHTSHLFLDLLIVVFYYSVIQCIASCVNNCISSIRFGLGEIIKDRSHHLVITGLVVG